MHGGEKVIIFDFDQTMVDTSSLEHLRRTRNWSAVHQGMRALEPYEGITNLLESLVAAGQKIAIVTTSPRAVPQRYSDSRKWPVDCIIGFHDTPRRKPYPDSLLLALERCGEEAVGSYHIGDRAQDTEAARAAGIVAIGAGWGSLELEILRQSRPDELFLSVADLRTFLLKAVN